MLNSIDLSISFDRVIKNTEAALSGRVKISSLNLQLDADQTRSTAT